MFNNKKNILIIAYFFPPPNSIAAIRTWKLVKYIKQHGYEPIVICGETNIDTGFETSDIEVHRIKCDILLEKYASVFKNKINSQKNKNNNNEMIHVHSSDAFNINVRQIIYLILKKIKRILSEIFEYPDAQSKWRKTVLPIASKIIDTKRIDLIYSSASPFTGHLIASDLSKIYGIPWVADYRDLWTLNHYISHLWIRLFLEKRLELRTLSSVSAVITVSEPAAEIQSKFLNRPVEVITNGFDPCDYNFYTEPYKNFTISYTGNIYSGKQDPSLLFSAVRKLIDNGKISSRNIRINFWGTDKIILDPIIKKYHLHEVVGIFERVSLEKSIIEQKKSTVLLLLSWNDLSQKGVYTGKVFEYLGANRPILAIPKNTGSVIDELLYKTRAGISCSSVEQLEDVLLNWYDTFYSTDTLPYTGMEEEIQKYNRVNQARQFAMLFDSVIFHHNQKE